MEESEGITRLKHGDISGLESLVARYYVQGVRTAYLVCRDREMAEDIVQAAFLRVYERIAQFDAERPFGPWFLRSIINDSLKRTMKRSRSISLESIAPDEVELIHSSDLTPEEMLAAAETRQAIWNALGKMSPNQRTAIVMRYYLGMSEADMSSRLDCPPGTIKWRLHVARKRLRQLLPTSIRNTDGISGIDVNSPYVTQHAEKGGKS